MRSDNNYNIQADKPNLCYKGTLYISTLANIVIQVHDNDIRAPLYR